MKTRDVVTAASVIADRYMVGLKVEDIKEAMVSAMLEYADLRERKPANDAESKDGKLHIPHVIKSVCEHRYTTAGTTEEFKEYCVKCGDKKY